MPRVTITVPEKNSQPYRFQLDRQVVSMGRGSDNDIAIDSGSVSVTHAEMRRIEGGYELHDIGSTNGIKLDGVRYDVIPLRSGATVKIGDVAFDFMLSEEENEALAREKPQEPSPITMDPGLPAPPRPKRSTYTPQPSSSLTFGGTLMFLILAAVAFFTGLAVHYQKDTGASLIEALKMRWTANSAPAIPLKPMEPPAVK